MNDRYVAYKAKFDNLQERLIDINKQIVEKREENTLIESANRFLISFSESIRQKLKDKLESLVNMALKRVFPDKEMKFMIVANPTKSNLHYDLYIDTDGNITSLYDSKGGGCLDIITLCLRISYLRMLRGSLRQTMILDEPFKNLDSTRLMLAIDWLKTISEEMKIQFLIITHIPELIEIVENCFEFKLINGKTVIKKSGDNG